MSYKAREVINGIYQSTEWSPNTNTKAYWKLSDDLKDYSGNGLHLTDAPYSGSTPVSIIEGYFGTGRYFAGTASNGSMLWNYTPVLTSTQSFTTSFWLKTTPTTTRMFFGMDSYTSAGCFFVGISGAGNLYCYFGNGAQWILGDNPVSQGVWHHLVVTGGAGTISFYVDGVKGTTYSYNYNTHSYLTWFGRFPDLDSGQEEGFKGTICEVIVENVTWSDDDVTDYYNKYKK